MQICVVIVSYNSEHVIESCLASLMTQKISKIIIVDNASQDQTVAKVSQSFPQIEIIKLAQNTGYGGGNNIGIRIALKHGTDYVLVLNPDTILEKDCLKKLLFHAEAHVQSRILGPKIYQAESHTVENKDEKVLWSVGGVLDKKRYTAGLVGLGEKDVGQFDQNSKVDFISGTCMLIPRKVFDTGIKFYEPYFLYYEDVEFCRMASLLGFPSYIVPDAKIIHFETSENKHKSLNSLKKNRNLKNYYLARNHLLFVERNAPFGVQLRETIRLPKTLLDHFKKGDGEAIEGIKDYFLRRFSAPTPA
ncbi:MAG: glycosyltransferase family 2 protein [Patescibacteria group bacterium]